MISFKGRHFEKTIILIAVRWYAAYSLSYRNIEEMLKECGISVDHATNSVIYEGVARIF